MKISKSYLKRWLSKGPNQLKFIKKLGASSLKDMGKVMGELKKEYSDKIDFAKAGSLIKGLLNK